EALRNGEPVVVETDKRKNKVQFKEKFSIIIEWVSIVATIISFLISSGQVTKIFKVIDLTSTITQISIGIITSLIASLLLFLIEKIHKRK
ncbi:MAG: hypothetical protein RR063_12635, partial [Anaerovoracaceae bacterium]